MVLLSVALGIGGGRAQEPSAATLAKEFRSPPDVARPRVYWYWQNGNITKEGLAKDLEWMHRVGIRGVETFDVAYQTPTIVKNRLIYMTPEWKDAFRYSLQVADRLGMDVTIGAAPGWSQTGGPWVTPRQAMKKMVWSETEISGGKTFHGVLAKPPATNGPFQTQPQAIRPNDAPVGPLPEYYADQRVIAFPSTRAGRKAAALRPKMTSSAGQVRAEEMGDGDILKATDVPVKAGQTGWVRMDFAEAQTVRGLVIGETDIAVGTANVLGGGRGQALEASDDGVHFRKVIELPATRLFERTFSFEPVTAKFFRVTLPSDVDRTFQVSELRLLAGTRVNRFEEKADFGPLPDLFAVPTPKASAEDVVERGRVIDLTSKMGADGTLEWTPPAGEWTVLRMGYSLTGKTNHPAPPEATGYEVDKLSRSATKAHMDEYLKRYEEASGGLMGKHGVKMVATDSWEAGYLNWTEGILDEFRRLRGYDAAPWLPALVGNVVDSSEATDRFLWDYRRTIADLVISANFDQVRDSLHEKGLLYTSEAHEISRAAPADGMEMKAQADVPMGAMWLPTLDRPRSYVPDTKETSSVAHLYGKKIASAESITSTGRLWGYGPWDLKLTADREFSTGINQFTLHVAVHQPAEQAPGLALGPYGQWINRHETWAEQFGAWTDYIAKTSYLMQQGQAVIDVAYFYGEEAPVTAINGGEAIEAPAGYNYDFVNSDALLHRLTVKDGGLVTATGMNYRVLYLGETAGRMTLPVLKKVREFVAQGAVVVGLRPADSPSLADDQAEWTRVAGEMWRDGAAVVGVGMGRVYRTQDLAKVLKVEAIQPDFSYLDTNPDGKVLFYHRRVGAGDIYWVDNRSDRATDIQARFRTAGKAPEVWHADTGRMERVSYAGTEVDTAVPIHLDGRDAVFVVFDHAAEKTSAIVAEAKEAVLAEMSGPWTVEFQAGRGAPASAMFDRLTDWTANADPGIKYFSGTGTYRKEFEFTAEHMRAGQRVLLDLGTVHELAEVVVNGKSMGVAWKPPYRVDVTDGLKPGRNEVEIKVVNLWPNRLIGDQQPGAAKVAFAPSSKYTADSPLLPSGLLGPVRVVAMIGSDVTE